MRPVAQGSRENGSYYHEDNSVNGHDCGKMLQLWSVDGLTAQHTVIVLRELTSNSTDGAAITPLKSR